MPSQFDEQLGASVWVGEHAGDAEATAWVKQAKLDANRDGTGEPVDWTQYGNTSSGRPRFWRSGTWRDLGTTVDVSDFLATVSGDFIMTTEGNLVTR